MSEANKNLGEVQPNGAESGKARASKPELGAPAGDHALSQHNGGQNDAPKPTVSHMLGELTWILSQSPAHKHFAIGDLEWLIMPAILLEQFRVFHGDKHPLGFALWANLSAEAEARMTTAVAAGGGARLRPDDWKSGDRLWLVELVAPFATPENKLTEAMIADLIGNAFDGRPLQLQVINSKTVKGGVKEVGNDRLD